MIHDLRSRLPLDVWAGMLLIAASGLIFLIEGLIRLAIEGGPSVLLIPAVLCGLDLIAAAGVFSGRRWTRPIVLAVVVIGAVWHLDAAMAGGIGWTRVVSAVLVVAQVYAIVLMYTGPVREHFGLFR
jgi:hypothetical protein